MRAESYSVVRVFNPGLVGLDCGEFGYQMWTRCVSRKSEVCALCGKQSSSGDAVFRPLTNAGNRWERIHATCLDPILEAVQSHEQGNS